jgi:hypothetical protein
MDTGDDFPGSKAAGAEVKNGRAIPPLPIISSWNSAQLIKHSDYLTGSNVRM